VLAIISILSRVVDSCSTISLTIWVYFNCLSTFLLYISLSMIFISPHYVPFLYLSAKICFNNLQFNCKKKKVIGSIPKWVPVQRIFWVPPVFPQICSKTFVHTQDFTRGIQVEKSFFPSTSFT
jgi:hypothetical protein